MLDIIFYAYLLSVTSLMMFAQVLSILSFKKFLSFVLKFCVYFQYISLFRYIFCKFSFSIWLVFMSIICRTEDFSFNKLKNINLSFISCLVDSIVTKPKAIEDFYMFTFRRFIILHFMIRALIHYELFL